MTLDEPREGETPETVNGIGVLMDPYARMFAEGATLDFFTTKYGDTFSIEPASGHSSCSL